MEKRPLGRTDLWITPVGFGSWAAGGGGWEFAWGPQDDRESIAAIHRALDLGINWIDTAAIYGLGHSEEIVGQAIAGREPRPLVFTKCSMLWDDQGKISRSLKADSIRRELEASLRRLKIDVIDLYQLHWPMPEDQLEEGWGTLAELKREGKVRYIGVSNFSVAQLERARAIAPVDSLQPPYSLVRPQVEVEVLPYCLEHGIGVIVYAPMMSGLLTGAMSPERAANFPPDDWRRRNPEFQEPRLSRNLGLADLLGQIASRHGRSTAEAAIAWTLRNPAVNGAIVGARRPEQVEGVVGAADFRLSPEELQEIDHVVQANASN